MAVYREKWGEKDIVRLEALVASRRCTFSAEKIFMWCNCDAKRTFKEAQNLSLWKMWLSWVDLAGVPYDRRTFVGCLAIPQRLRVKNQYDGYYPYAEGPRAKVKGKGTPDEGRAESGSMPTKG